MKKSSIISLLAISLLSSQAWAENTAAPATSTNNAQTSTPQAINQTTWLGVILAPVPSALSAQLNELIPSQQGVLVQSVVPNSPAAKAGIQANDVLLSFGDQKLYSPSQLSGLVKSFQSGKQIEVQAVSHGKLKTLNVTLEAQQRANVSAQGLLAIKVKHWKLNKMVFIELHYSESLSTMLFFP